MVATTFTFRARMSERVRRQRLSQSKPAPPVLEAVYPADALDAEFRVRLSSFPDLRLDDDGNAALDLCPIGQVRVEPTAHISVEDDELLLLHGLASPPSPPVLHTDHDDALEELDLDIEDQDQLLEAVQRHQAAAERRAAQERKARSEFETETINYETGLSDFRRSTRDWLARKRVDKGLIPGGGAQSALHAAQLAVDGLDTHGNTLVESGDDVASLAGYADHLVQLVRDVVAAIDDDAASRTRAAEIQRQRDADLKLVLEHGSDAERELIEEFGVGVAKSVVFDIGLRVERPGWSPAQDVPISFRENKESYPTDALRLWKRAREHDPAARLRFAVFDSERLHFEHTSEVFVILTPDGRHFTLDEFGDASGHWAGWVATSVYRGRLLVLGGPEASRL